MHASTLFLVALASIMVTFSSAKLLDRQNSVASVVPGFGNQGSHGDFHQKRKMRKRFSPGNYGTRQGSYVAPVSSGGGGGSDAGGGGAAGGRVAESGLVDGLPIVGDLL